MLSKKYQKWIKEVQGQGELADYRPWIKISDISSGALKQSGCQRVVTDIAEAKRAIRKYTWGYY